MSKNMYPVGKIPAPDLEAILKRLPSSPHERLLIGPGIGMDCAILDFGETLLAVKSDPVTFATENIGWYSVHVNANDIATTGAMPRWFMATILLPEGNTDYARVEQIFDQICAACQTLGITLAGGHTEITAGLKRPIVAGTMLGEVSRDDLITPQGIKPGDRILLTKGVPIEAASILANEFPPDASLPANVLAAARNYLYDPGISVVQDAHCACEAGGVTAMHDPTEGGIITGLIELAIASQVALHINKDAIPILPEAALICMAAGVNPLEAIASGALLIAAESDRVSSICNSLGQIGIPAVEIGTAAAGQGVWFVEGDNKEAVELPERDAIARLFENEV
ncbi:MAG: AIR synthase family protein [Anaerolineales bacterium]|nr:AIR synthase family protein [Anaerolineales bacterium]